MDGMVSVAFQTSYSVPLTVMFWSNGIAVSTGPVVTPDAGVEEVGARVRLHMPLECSVRKRRVTCVFSGTAPS